MSVAFAMSTPHLDHGRRHEHLRLARLEARHRRLPRAGLEPAVDEIDLHLRQRRCDSLRRLARGAQIALLRLLDQRVHDVGLFAARDRLLEQP
jgi:hypothetical protein